MTDYSELVKALRDCADTCNIIDECEFVCPYNNELPRCVDKMMQDAAAAIEALQAEVNRLKDKLCDWCAVCPKERRNPDDCELIGNNPVMYGPSEEKPPQEVQE